MQIDAVYIRHGRQTRRASSEEIRSLTLRETPEIFEPGDPQFMATASHFTVTLPANTPYASI